MNRMTETVNFYFVEPSPPSRPVWMVLEELGLKYNECIVDLSKNKHKSEAFKKISFRQKVPAIKDGDFVLAESCAIATYLVNKYGTPQQKQQLYPQETKARAKMDQLLYISVDGCDEIRSYLNIGGVLWKNEKPRPEVIPRVHIVLAQIEEMLQDKPYTAAEHLTLADFFYYAAVYALEISDFDGMREYPKILEWKKKMAELPYHKKTCKDPITRLRERYQEQIRKQ